MLKKLIISTLILNLLILVGAGHGIGFLGMLEIVILISEDFIYSFGDDYQKLQAIAAILSLFGQLVLILGLFWKEALKYIILIALSVLYTGIVLLSWEYGYNASSALSLYTAIPFFILSLILIQKVYFKNKTGL